MSTLVDGLLSTEVVTQIYKASDALDWVKARLLANKEKDWEWNIPKLKLQL